MDVVNLCGPSTDPFDSYGMLFCRLAWHLSERGVHVNPQVFERGNPLHAYQTPELQAVLSRPVRPALGGILLGYPVNFHKMGTLVDKGPTVAVTMFESDCLPDGWAEALNACRAVVVPSQWCARVFRAGGVTVPVHVVPLGVSEAYTYVERPKRKPFTFLCIADRWRRKGWDILIPAFAEAFGRDNPDVRLVIKAREGAFKFDIMPRNIAVIRRDYTEAQMQQMYADADAFVFPTRGEGFGLPPREAAATGLPVIATDWGGTADDLRAWGYPLRSTLVDAWPNHETLRGCGQWAEPDRAHLVEQLRYVASGNPYVTGMARHAARRVRKLYSWDAFAAGVWAIWQHASAPVLSDRRRRRLEKRTEAAYANSHAAD